ncbi:type I-E CRISPR-associated protein Cas6/Cse3/CasE [Embleya sp. MST-111070]|uniref:type I-E CRISPR-associated protein Cas6/Cse3/CasE n=1 Tax=Embleya sp. MST-111070 TaxID=3398231 RepID=UPI003F734CBE
MFLTRFRVNTARIGARRLLSSPQVLHAGVMSSFPDILPNTNDAPRVLWRIDHNAKAEVLLYIVSPTRPDLTHLVEQAGWPTLSPGWDTYDYSAFLDRLSPGSTWAFRLTANPVHSIRHADGEPTKRTAHRTPRHQMGWLLQRQETCGFRVLRKPVDRRLTSEGDEFELSVHSGRGLSFAKAGGPEGRTGSRVSLATVTFDGRLEVVDAPTLRRTLVAGLGKAKAYGCGLMTLAPVG